MKAYRWVIFIELQSEIRELEAKLIRLRSGQNLLKDLIRTAKQIISS